MNASAALKHYANVKIDAGVQGASAHRLIAMLYEGLLTRIAQAKGAIQQRDFENKSRKITEAMNIVLGLRDALDTSAGGELAANLASLYDYLHRALLQANLRNDVTRLDECRELILPVSSAWEQMKMSA